MYLFEGWVFGWLTQVASMLVLGVLVEYGGLYFVSILSERTFSPSAMFLDVSPMYVMIMPLLSPTMLLILFTTSLQEFFKSFSPVKTGFASATIWFV